MRVLLQPTVVALIQMQQDSLKATVYTLLMPAAAVHNHPSVEITYYNMASLCQHVTDV